MTLRPNYFKHKIEIRVTIRKEVGHIMTADNSHGLL